MKTFQILIIFFIVFSTEKSLSQTQEFSGEGHLVWGFTLGGNRSIITHLEYTTLSEPYFDKASYSLTTERRSGFTGGLFTNFKFKNAPVTLYVEAAYSSQSSRLFFDNYQKDFNYKMSFKYDYINVPILVIWHPFLDGSSENNKEYISGIHIGIGPQIGFNTAPHAISYEHGGPGYEPAFDSDPVMTEKLVSVLRGSFANVGATAEIGVMFPGVIDVNFRYHQGISDAVKTIYSPFNSLNFVENPNRIGVFQVVVKFGISKFVVK